MANLGRGLCFHKKITYVCKCTDKPLGTSGLTGSTLGLLEESVAAVGTIGFSGSAKGKHLGLVLIMEYTLAKKEIDNEKLTTYKLRLKQTHWRPWLALKEMAEPLELAQVELFQAQLLDRNSSEDSSIKKGSNTNSFDSYHISLIQP